jgi:hypothetical protein
MCRVSFWRLTDAMIDLDHMLLLCWAFAGGTEGGSWIGELRNRNSMTGEFGKLRMM